MVLGNEGEVERRGWLAEGKDQWELAEHDLAGTGVRVWWGAGKAGGCEAILRHMKKRHYKE